MANRFKTGCNFKPLRMSTPALGDYLVRTSEWPTVKPWGWEFVVDPSTLGMLGNDVRGCCVPAAGGHYVRNESANTDYPLFPTTPQTLALYTALTGFDPSQDVVDPDGNISNPTDQGTDPETLMSYWKSTGIPVNDANGKEVMHTILGWSSLDVTSWAQLRYAAYTFGGILYAINLPQSAMDDTTNWVWVPGSPNLGGHMVNQAGEGSAGGRLNTWGMVVPFTKEFARNTTVSAFAVVTPFWLNRQGVSPSGLDLNGLLTAMQAL